MSLTAGTKLGPYEVVAPLGAGGMGEVYRARDTTLGREVAIKTLPDAFADDPDRLARFEREARLLAALNHPHIATIHGLEASGGTRFLVLELVEGETLAERLAPGALPVEDAVRLALQIADALEAAHEKGVIHRDLKPANVKVTPEGRVKVLDFGLAKALDAEPARADAGLSQSPTLSLAATQQGVILGTAAYMSPEQAKGRPVDRQTDIWAFGCLLYEMLAGRAAFEGDDVSEILASVIKGRVELDRLPAAVPARLRDLLARCLSKDPRQRFRDIGDVRFELARIAADPAGGHVMAPAGAAPGMTRAWMAAAVVLTAIVSALAAWFVAQPDPQPQPIVRLTAAHPGDEVVRTRTEPEVALSPDGRRIAYVATPAGAVGVDANRGRLYLRDLDQLTPRLLAESASSPFFSPDGQWVGFVRDRLIHRVAVTGGSPIPIGPLAALPYGLSWGPDGRIVFAGSAIEPGLWSMPASGGEATALTTPDVARGEFRHLFPEILPGGQAVLFTIRRSRTVQARDDDRIAVLDLASGEYRVLIEGGSSPRYAASGHLVYAVSGRLQAVAFDLDRLDVRGIPVSVVEGVQWKVTGAVSLSLSADGTLAYVAGSGPPEISQSATLLWVDRTGGEEDILAEPLDPRVSAPRVSPDGTRVALDLADPDGGRDVWIYELARGTFQRITRGSGLAGQPVWTPDGRRLAYTADTRDDGAGIFWRAADGSGEEERLTTGDRQIPESWTPDGRHLLFTNAGDLGSPDVAIVSLDEPRSVRALVASPAGEGRPRVSPDGRWLAYQSNETGRGEIYVRPFPDVDGPRWLVSTGGGVSPAWAPDGGTLYYTAGVAGTGTRLMAVAVTRGEPSTWGRPERLLEEGAYTFAAGWDIAPDGRFLLIKRAEVASDAGDAADGPREIVVVLNWLDELQRLVP